MYKQLPVVRYMIQHGCVILQVLGGLHKIKNKLTGVGVYARNKTLFLFLTLPNVTTGGYNLTLTILVRLISLGVLDNTVDVCTSIGTTAPTRRTS